MEKKQSKGRWRAFAFFPLFFLVRAVCSCWTSLRSREAGELEDEGELDMPYRREKRKIVTRDGTRLTASVWIPEGTGPFPAVIMVHSWGLWRLQPDLLHAASFARRGYVVLTYTCRGWGLFNDQVCVTAPDKELCDLEDAIDWLVDPEMGFPVDPERIGITGISYGGGHSFLAATRDPRIKAAAPMNGWTDLYFSLVPNDSWKAPWTGLLMVLGIWAHRFSPKNILMRWAKALLIEWNPRKLKEDCDERSAIHDVGKVKCPMFIVHSWNDDLFEPNQILKFYKELNVPKKLHIANGPHGLDAGRGDLFVPNKIWDDARRWFDYWLKGDRDNGIDKEPAVTFFQPWNGMMGTAHHWPPEGIADVTYFLRGEAAADAGALSPLPPDDGEPLERLVNNTVSNLQSSGPPLFRPNVIKNLPMPGVPFTINGDSIAFTSKPFSSDAVMVGAPHVNIHAASSTNECQLNAMLYDVSPRGFPRLLTHCVMTKNDMVPGEVREFDFELIACAHMFKPGHKARLVLCAADPLYVMPSQVPSQYRIAHTVEHPSSVALPLMGVAAS